MGDFDRYGLPELCDVVGVDRPEDMRRQADGWAAAADLLDDRLRMVTALRTRLRRAWAGPADGQLSALDQLVTVLTDAAQIARNNRTIWFGIAHYVEYAKDELEKLRQQWTVAEASTAPSADQRYVPDDIAVTVGDSTSDAQLRSSYDQVARDIMDAATGHILELSEGLAEMPGYLPPVLGTDGMNIMPIPVHVGASAPGMAGPPGSKEDQPELQYGPGNGVPINPGGGMAGMGGMGSGSGPILSSAPGVPGSGGPMLPTSVSSGGYTSSVLGTPTIPTAGTSRPRYITRAPKVTSSTTGKDVIGRTRRPVVVPVEYDVERLRERPESGAVDEDNPWETGEPTVPGIISGR